MHSWRSSCFCVATVCLLGAVAAPDAYGGPPSAVPAQAAGDLQSEQAQAESLAAQVAADDAKLDQLDQQFDAAEQQVQSVDEALLRNESEVVATQAGVNGAESQLRSEALLSYTEDGADEELGRLFASGGVRSTLVGEYVGVASANISATVDRLDQEKAALARQQSQLAATYATARDTQDQVASARSQAQAVTASETAALGRVKGQMAALVAAREAEQEAAGPSSFAARLASSAPLDADAPVAPGAQGAVHAAESQLGVPYVWGGEDPGVGFDCSGLTQWAWGQAGVRIPRTAQEQYDAVAHVPLSDLEPGDLLFWDDGTSSVEHVAMYVGGGQVVQAPHTGATVSYSPVWGQGLVGAGRP